LNTATNSPHIQVAERKKFIVSAQFHIGAAHIERSFSDDVGRGLVALVAADANGLPIESIPFASTLALRSAGIKLRRFVSGGAQRIALANPGSIKVIGGAR
jgi:hypothetical protein